MGSDGAKIRKRKEVISGTEEEGEKRGNIIIDGFVVVIINDRKGK